MTDRSDKTSQEKAFLHSIEDVITRAVQTLDLNKVHDLSPEELKPHFDLIVSEAWEDYNVDVQDLGAFRDMTESKLFAFKRYYDVLKNDDVSATELKGKIRDPEFKKYLKAFLEEGLRNGVIYVAIKQGLVSEKETSPEIELAKSFNVAAKNLVALAKDAFENRPLDRMSDNEINALADKNGEILANSINGDGARNSIFLSILTNQFKIALQQLKTEIEEGQASDSNIQSIYEQAQEDTLSILFDVAERTQIISKDIRKHEDLGFEPPQPMRR